MARFHDERAADAAEAEFNNRFRAGAMPSDIPELTVQATVIFAHLRLPT